MINHPVWQNACRTGHQQNDGLDKAPDTTKQHGKEHHVQGFLQRGYKLVNRK
ncbi:hypothetical protein SDC9_183018 [bioreactor metagenome]|uniref:Uncharacterized protein n=1 Tax=bioreactor metagenome TaxID=1076179 RepID=A0A645H9X9_9ZZZZ